MSDSPTRLGAFVAAAVMLIASTATVGLRLSVRKIKRSYLGLDDLFISVSLFFVWALAIILIVATARGIAGTHNLSDHVEVTQHEVEMYKFAFTSQVLSIIVFGTLKLSVLFLFRRIFHSNKFEIISISVIGLVITSTVAFLFATLFQCRNNPAWLWAGSNSAAKHCGAYKHIQLGQAVTDVATGLLVLIVPIPVIWKLHTSLAQKTGIIIVFLLGYLSAAAACVRIVFIVNDNYKITSTSHDILGSGTNMMIWGYIEATVGIIAASLPTLTPLLQGEIQEHRISLTSTRSQKRGAENLETNTWSYEMPNRDIYGQSSSQLTTRIEREVSNNFGGEIPGGRILRQDNVVVKEERF